MANRKLTMEVYGIPRTSVMRLSINRRAADGTGDGYRIAGPSFDGSGEMLLRRELNEGDAREIRGYLDDVFPPEPGQSDATAGSPLTCNACLHAPATLLAAMGRTNADRTAAPGHVLRLLCRDCADRTRDIMRRGGRAVTFFAIGSEEATDG